MAEKQKSVFVRFNMEDQSDKELSLVREQQVFYPWQSLFAEYLLFFREGYFQYYLAVCRTCSVFW